MVVDVTGGVSMNGLARVGRNTALVTHWDNSPNSGASSLESQSWSILPTLSR